MKRLFSLFLIGMLTLSLSACTGNPREPSAESTNVSDETNSAGASEAANHMDHTKLTQWSSNTAISPLKKVKNPGKISFDDYSRQLDRRADNPIDEPFLQAVNSFAGELSVQMLCGQDENLNFSPVSLYMALSLAASGAKGATQEELLAASAAKAWIIWPRSPAICSNGFIGIMKSASCTWQILFGCDRIAISAKHLLIGRPKNFTLPPTVWILQIPKRPRR